MTVVENMQCNEAPNEGSKSIYYTIIRPETPVRFEAQDDANREYAMQ